MKCVSYIILMCLWGILAAAAGGVIGFALAFCFDLFSCGWNIVTCHWFHGGMSGVNYTDWAVAGALIGALVGVVFGFFGAREAEAEEKREKQEAEAEKERQIQKAAEELAAALRKTSKEAFNSWIADLHTAATDLVASIQLKSKNQAQDNLERLMVFKNQAAEYDTDPPVDIDVDKYKGQYGKNYETVYTWVCSKVIEQLCNFINGPLHHHADNTALDGIETCLLVISKINPCFTSGHHAEDGASCSVETALQLVRKSKDLLHNDVSIISFDGYGIVSFGDDDPRAWTHEKANDAYEEFCHCLKKLDSEALERDCIGGASTLSVEFFAMAARLMWHYADETPFNVERFDQVRDVYNAFTAHAEYIASVRENVCLGNTEEVLARIYAKNKIGGAATAGQEEPHLFAWLEDRISQEDFESCYHLVSGLAWLGLFDLELRILRLFVDKKVQMTEELQNRLGVLESGRTLAVRIFDVEPTDDFVFDSSSIEWNAKDLSFFFRSLAVKKAELAYSLALTKWTKALPLQKGLKISPDEIFEAFDDLTLDYDGEVACMRVAASAVDHAGLRYENATLFRFSSERSRCLSMLFTCEKFGRNLNVTIYTLFTPESGLSLSNLENYAMAAKTNIYMDAFRESVLQVLDEVVKVEKSIYGDDETKPDSSARSIIA